MFTAHESLNAEVTHIQMINEPKDIRLKIFRKHMDQNITARLVVEKPGVLSGIKRAHDLMEGLGLKFSTHLNDTQDLVAGQEIARVTGDPFQIAKAEELIIGTLSKSSGIATAARRAQRQAGHRCKVVSGGWKKMPVEIKGMIRQAVSDGGLDVRMSQQPFIYLDKNYVRILGGIVDATNAAVRLGHGVIVQIRGETAPVGEESVAAASAGAEAVMIDTGHREDIIRVVDALKKRGLRSKVRIAFSGNILLDEIESLSQLDVDVLDIGYAILDAPCLPMHFDVVEDAGQERVKSNSGEERIS